MVVYVEPLRYLGRELIFYIDFFFTIKAYMAIFCAYEMKRRRKLNKILLDEIVIIAVYAL